MSEKTASYGLTSWNESANRPKKQVDFKKIPFIKFKNGKNTVRFITEPYGYYAAKIKGPGTPHFGSRVKVAYPAVKRDEDPILKHGVKYQRRYYVGAIYKGTPNDPQEWVGIIDMGQNGLYNQLQENILNEEEYPDDLRELDVRVSKNPEGSAANYYMATPLPAKPMSESELKLEEEYREQLERLLKILSTPNSIEKVEDIVAQSGWVPEDKEEKAEAKSEDTSSDDSNSDDDDGDDDDYDFTPPGE